MLETSVEPWRITVRLEAKLRDKVKEAARVKRWSVNDFIEEAIILALDE